VLLAHATGLGRDGFRYGRDATLAQALVARGFAVYLLSHRGDRFAVGGDARAPTDFDAILERDVPAALDRIREHSGFPRIHWVGHGLGGQLGLAWAGRGGEYLATIAAIAAPVAFEHPRSEGRRLAIASHLLPAGMAVPVRWMARVAAPLLGADDLGAHLSSGASPGARVRGAACWAAEDVSVGLARQVAGWVGQGCWSSRSGIVDYAATLGSARVPLLAVVGGDDRICSPEAALRAVELWGGRDRTAARIPGYGHLDALFGADAEARVFAPLASWLHARRRHAWEEGFAG
jgi:pimeloyl-ACP methyl ester carboxylesterase